MGSGRTDGDVVTVASHNPDFPRPLRWPWRAGSGALAGLALTTCLYPSNHKPFVVLCGIDGFGWSFLFGLATFVLTVAFAGGAVHLLTRDRRGWWAPVLSSATMLLLSVVLLFGLPIGFLVGVLSFKNSYRDLDDVNGRTIVVQQSAGWDTDDQIDAGYRHGPFVTFEAAGDTYLDRPSTGIGTWRFSVITTSETVEVHYSASGRPNQSGTLTLPLRHP